MKLSILNIKDTCTGCGACCSICPKSCLKLGTDEYGFFYPIYDSNACIECHLCEKSCHVITPLESQTVNKENFNYYISNDHQTILNSSSGGAFTLFAEYVIQRKGIVFGSWYNREKKRLEVGNSDNVDWTLFRKSKYIESYMGNSCSVIATNLQNDRLVLFCGTPCQVSGVHTYLNKRKINTNKLILIDFVCHGVPTNLLFQSFLNKYDFKNNVSYVDFRHKDFSNNFGWHDLAMKLVDNNNQTVIPYLPPYSFYYLKPFADDCAHRLCCFDCKYLDKSVADVTLGDFWGVDKFDKTLDKNQGISLVKLNSASVLPIWNKIKIQGQTCPVPYEYVSYLYNKNARFYNLPRRNRFLHNLKHKGINIAVFLAYTKELIEFYSIGQVKKAIKMIINK